MEDSERFKNFIEDGIFTEEKINKLKKKLSVSDKRLIRETFNLLNGEIVYLDKSLNYTYIINNCVDFLNVICNDEIFTVEERTINRNRIKKSREALLAFYNKYKQDDLLKAANKLDEIILDKGIDLNDLIKLIKRLIDRKEDINIIKKLLNTNKGVLKKNNNELFDYSFKKSTDALYNNTPDIYYYISLLKIFYSSNINKTKYITEISRECYDSNEFANEIYSIIHGHRRNLNPDEVLNKYGIIKDLETVNIITPDHYNNDGIVITLDSDGTDLRDDAVSIKKDGNNHIVDIYITDPTSFVVPKSVIDYQALNNFESKYLPDYSTQILSDDFEKYFSLDKDTNRKVLDMKIVIDNEGNIKDYNLSSNVIRINENYDYSDGDLILNNYNNDISQIMKELYEVACLLEQKNKEKYKYWDLKEQNSNNTHTTHHKSDKIINELMVLYNYLIAKLACLSNTPYTYKIQNASYVGNLVNKLNIKIDSDAQKVIDSIYLKSRYSPYPIYHSGLHLDVYSSSTCPLRKYPSLYNQLLIHGLYLKDIKYDYNEEYHKEMIEYFNQRDVELSLMASEYTRSLKIKKD